MNLKQTIIFVLLAFLWGISFPIYRHVVPGLNGVAVAAVRIEFGALAMLVFAFATMKRDSWRLIWDKRYTLFLVALFNPAIPFALLAYMTSTFGAGLTSLTNAVTPMWSALLAWIWLKDRLTLTQSVGLALGFFGVMLIGWDEVIVTRGYEKLLPLLAGIAAALMYSIAAVLTSKFLKEVASLVVTTGVLLGAAIVMAPLLFISWPDGGFTVQETGWIAITGVGGTALAYALLYYLFAEIGITKTVTVTYLIPVVSIVLGVVLLDEQLSLSFMVSTCLVLLGIALSTSDKSAFRLAGHVASIGAIAKRRFSRRG